MTMIATEKQISKDPVYIQRSVDLPRRRDLEHLTILPLREFLEALWNREYSS